MNGRPSSILGQALSLLSAPVVLMQIALAVAVALLFALWLHVPDASGWDIIGSVVLALIIIAVAGAGESALMLRLAARDRTPGRLLRGTLLLCVTVALWLVWSWFLGSEQAKDSLRAGYYNSRLPAGMRYFFTYTRIAQWLGVMWTVLTWVGAGVLAVAVFFATASARPHRALTRCMRSLTCWISIFLGAILTSLVTTSVMGWMPGHGLRREMLSLALRLTSVVLFDAAIVCLVLCVFAALTRSVDALAQSTLGGTLDPSQPRTTDTP